MNAKYDISVVVPLFNEEESLPELCDWIDRVMNEHNFTYEVILVDDGSYDTSWEVVTKISSSNANIKGISFNRNYGKSAALDTGFKAVAGRIVITMDADLQDSPDEIPELYKMIVEDGYDLVSGWKKKRYDPISKTIPTKLFNAATRALSKIKLNDFNCGLKAYKVEVVKSIDVYGEMHRYIPVIAKWAGYRKIGEKVVEHRARKYGTTKFGLERFIHGFLDLMTITFVSKFKKSPMHFFGLWGTVSFFTGFLFLMWLIGDVVYTKWFTDDHIGRELTQDPKFFLCLIALVLGSQSFLAGFIGEMIQVNQKNEYLIKERKNLD